MGRPPAAIELLSWPFSQIRGRSGNLTGFAVLHGPLQDEADLDVFARLRDQLRFIGFASYTDFPRPYRRDPSAHWLLACEGWCHCFRDPENYLPPGRPAALISYSDFVDLRPKFPRTGTSKVYDAAFVCPAGGWTEYTKNWQLARRCIAALSRAGRRVVAIGRTDLTEGSVGAAVVTLPQLSHPELLDVLSDSRCIVVASVMDASPRLIAESLCLDVPVVVNRQILGGWKYVNRHTGRFFDDERSVVRAVDDAIAGCRAPYRWFTANFGPYVSGRRLARFLHEIDDSFSELRVSVETWRPARGET